ncbi:MAG TPA: hypothetical protein DHW34_00275 [Actinobacteria bacterium]|nr:hypothetical protein [Actinomycetota bacterium]HCK78437.1 hypothetical protein [Actinomycetota bacterium]
MKFKFAKAAPAAWFVAGLVVAGSVGTAAAANGSYIKIGLSNVGTKTTTLSSTSVPLKLVAPAGKAPLSVGANTTKVPNLNADKLDGKDSSAFQTKIGNLSFTSLTPATGWTGNCYSGSPGIAASVDGVVHFHGDVCSSDGSQPASSLIFTIPSQFRPSTTKYLTADLCNTNTGRIIVQSNGEVYVNDDPADTGPTYASACFVSLDGITYTLPY